MRLSDRGIANKTALANSVFVNEKKRLQDDGP
jgi:hypothetical protein